MSLSTNEIIKFIIDNSEVDVDDLLQHLWNIKLNQRIIINNNDEEVPPPIPDEVPEYKKSKHYLYDEIDETPDENGWIMYRIFYDTDISDEELLKYHPKFGTGYKYLFIRYRTAYTSVYWPINIDIN